MVIIIPRQKLQSVLHTDTFVSNEQLLVCLANGKNSAVIMGLEQYFRVKYPGHNQTERRNGNARVREILVK